MNSFSKILEEIDKESSNYHRGLSFKERLRRLMSVPMFADHVDTVRDLLLRTRS